MKINIDKIEKKLKYIFESCLSGALFNNLHNQISEELCNTILRATREDENGDKIAPNKFTFFLSKDALKGIENKNTLSNTLATTLEELLADTGLRTHAPVVFLFASDKEIKNNDLRIEFEFTDASVDNTSVFEVNLNSKQDVDNSWAHAFIIFKDQLINITQPVFNIGRGEGNNLIIDDRYISRAHAQIRQIDKKYVIIDLNSSGGTYLNGERVTQQNLRPGDIITLSKIDLIFGIEDGPTLADTTKHTIT